MSDDGTDWETGDTGDLLRAVIENPYIREADLRDASSLDADAFDAALGRLTDADVLVGLTRQSGSSLESRVPHTVYLVNPERAHEFDGDEREE